MLIDGCTSESFGKERREVANLIFREGRDRLRLSGKKVLEQPLILFHENALEDSSDRVLGDLDRMRGQERTVWYSFEIHGSLRGFVQHEIEFRIRRAAFERQQGAEKNHAKAGEGKWTCHERSAPSHRIINVAQVSTDGMEP